MVIYRRHLKSCPHRREGRRYWRCNCPFGFDATVDGRRTNKSTGLSDRNAAQDFADRWINGDSETAKTEPPVQEVKEEPISLEDAWEMFLAHVRIARKRRPATIYKYDLLRRRMLEFANRHGLRLLKDFHLDILEEFQAEWEEGPLSCSKKLERLKAFFAAAFKRKWIDENPADALEGPEPDRRPTLPFTRGEMGRILAAVDQYPDKSGKTGRDNSARLRAFVLTLRYSGLRIGDATRLGVECLAANKIYLNTQKTGEPVYCVLPEFVAEILANAPRLSERYFFWTGNSTLHTAIGIWQRTLRNLFRLAGVKNGYAHRFRDTFSTELLLAGVPMENVSVLLGHSSIKITQKHYSPWVRERQERLEADLERAWSRDPVVLAQTKVNQAYEIKPDSRPN
jgi:integrase